MTFHTTLLVDVDDTLMAPHYYKGNKFNDDLITSLVKSGIKKISLFTKMDLSIYSTNYVLRHELINYLAEKGIEVEDVLTPYELLFRDVFSTNAPLGDFYRKYLKPIEEALFNLSKEMRIDQAEKLINFISYKREIEFLCCYAKHILSQHAALSVADFQKLNHSTLAHKMIKENLDLEMDNYFSMSIDHLISQHIYEKKIDKSVLLSKVLEQFEEDLEQQTYPFLKDEYKSICDVYEKAMLTYRNIYYNIFLNSEKLKTPEGESGYSKGELYQQYIHEKQLNVETNHVFFIDNSAEERQSVLKYHHDNDFKNSLGVAPPPAFYDEPCANFGIRDDKAASLSLEKFEILFNKNKIYLLKDQLEKYLENRKNKHTPSNMKYKSRQFFSQCLHLDYVAKKSAAENLLNYLHGKVVNFNQSEWDALSDGHLRKIYTEIKRLHLEEHKDFSGKIIKEEATKIFSRQMI